jgi:hypothetical protein
MSEERSLIRSETGADLVVEHELLGTTDALNALAQGIRSERWDDIIFEVSRESDGKTHLKFRAYRSRSDG